MTKNVFSLIALILLSVHLLIAQIPAGYYDNAEEKNGLELKVALYNIIKDHTALTYTNLWTAFQYTDKRADGKVWDMYSSCDFTFGTHQDNGTGGTTECEKYNREHSIPASWFSNATPIYTDLFHLYPTDKKVNSVRANYPFGRVGSPTYTSSNGSKLGNSNYPGYSSIVFEPIDEYKGDFARTYFYMATRYHNVVQNWSSPMLAGNQFPAFTEWAINLLMEWHESDPVSQKEINRNNEIYDRYQHNRNPFIDRPDFVDLVWGDGNSASTNTYTNQVNIYPNPANNRITISTVDYTDIEVRIYSVVGTQLIKESFSGHNGSVELSLVELPKGIYLVNVKSKKLDLTSRVIISR